MMIEESSAQDSADTQKESHNWWTRNPMSYDWHGTNSAPEGTIEFFDETDRRFFNSSPLYRGRRPFEELIPFDRLAGKRVLEIGCGMGSHSELLASAGCKLTSIDLTERAVDLTRKRLALRKLSADVRQMDAEQMDFSDGAFDFVWSWGVIHHSPHTDRIMREVARVLRPKGEFRFMVYNRHAFDSYVKILRGFLTGKTFKGMSVAEILNHYTDGYIARHFTRPELSRLIASCGLQTVAISILGQTSELLPLPGTGILGRFKYALLPRLPPALMGRALRSLGFFLFAVTVKPDSIE